ANPIDPNHQSESNIETLLMLESTLEATDNGILVVSEDGKVLHTNKRFVKMWGIPETLLAEGKDKSLLLFASEQLIDPQSFVKTVESLYANADAEAYDVLRFKDGRILERSSAPMLLNGKSAGRVWSFRDVTERNRAEEALHLSQERLFLALQVSNAGIWEWDTTNNKVHFDDQFHVILGYEPGELPNNLQEWLAFHHPEDAAMMLAKADAYLKGLSPIFESEHRIRTKTGEWAWVFTRGQVIKSNNTNANELFIGMAMNTTQHKRNEEELSLYRAHLEDLVEKRTAELIETNHELEAFSYSVSHDLRAPLRSMDGYSKIILEDYSDLLDDAGRTYLANIRSSARQMDELIDNLLKLSRLNQTQIQIEEVHLSEIIKAITSDLIKNNSHRNGEFMIMDEIIVEGDKNLLTIALENLISNAWKFTINNPQGKIEFGVSEGIYYIRDNGIGFDMSQKDRLFLPFQRLHSEKEYPGSGIGLSIVQRIIKRHGGRIWAESEKTKGATFFFTLH
ncbi:PAS domain S-box protein, partial [bacterium]|nr:PAS domain S-box protein [bacterium]